jgi:hypothetical protein
MLQEQKFQLEITQEHENGKQLFQLGKRVKQVITDEPLGL